MRNKTMCKIIALGMTFSLVTCSMPCKSVFAADTKVTINSEENGLVVEGKVLVSGKNATGDVVIPEGITSIAKEAFYENNNITSVKIPSSVTEIGEFAFSRCSNFTSVKIPGSVKVMGEGAFEFAGLKDAVIEDGVETIGIRAFMNCYYLKPVNIPSSVTKIDDNAFTGCSSVTSIKIPASVKVIGREAFDLTKLKDIEIENGVETIEQGAFESCYDLESINIPDSVTQIGDYAFYRCTNLKDIKYNKNAQVGKDAFGFTKYLENEGNLYIQNNVLVKADSEISGVVTIPDEVTEIGEEAFSGRKNIIKVIIGKNVKKIGSKAFFSCSSLSEVVLPDSLETIGDNAFVYCKSLNTISFPKNLKTIDKSAFEDCSSLSEISIPDSVNFIGEYAFKGCTNLNTVNINLPGKTIEGKAFPVGVVLNGDTSNNTSIPILKSGWNQIGENWYYADSEGKMLRSQWYYNGRDWYYLGENGVMYYGRFATIDGTEYFFNYPNGEMVTGWKLLRKRDTNWYYFNPNSDGTKGAMAKSKWVKTGGKWYYLKADGTMAVNEVIDGYKVDSTGAWVE